MPAPALVGRDRPAALLRAAWDRARDGRGGLVLVTGEPGVGKTSLVTTVAEEVRRSGAVVLNGTCWDGQGAPDYWPWVQVVRGLQSRHPAQWERAREVAGDGLSHLLGEHSGAAAPTSVPVAGDVGFRLYDAVTTVLVTASRQEPVMVVLDDLQWADRASLRLLDFLVRHTALEAVLVLATCRDADVDALDHPRRDLVLDVSSRAATVALGGLDPDAVALLMAGVAGREPEPSLVAEVHRRTGGNPFFVEQTARLWAAGSSIATLTPGVRDAVDRRVARLPARTAGMLATAATLGHDFDAAVLATASEVDPATVEEALAPALSTGLVAAAGEGRYAFAHDLVREAFDAAVDAGDRRRRYAAVVRAVAGGGPVAGRVMPAQVADFAYRAVPDVDPAAAADLLVAAARDAATRLASEEAAMHYVRALELIPGEESGRRTAVALALGGEQQRAGELEAARRTYDEVLSAARRHGDGETFAFAVLGLHSLGETIGGESLVDRLEEAWELLEASPGRSDGLAARVLAASARARAHQVGGDRDLAEGASASAVALARAAGDDGALGFCLLARHDAIWKPGTAAERVALGAEMREVARRTGDVELDLQGSLLCAVARLELGDPAGLREAAAFFALAERTRLPRFRYLALSRQGTLATFQGRFAEARRLVDEARDLAEQLGEVDALSLWTDQAWELDRLQGTSGEVDALVAMLRAQGDRHVVVMEAALAVDAGDAATARRLLPDVEALGRVWPRWAQLIWMTFQAELAVVLGDPARRAEVRAAIAPFVDQWVVLAGGVIVRGPMSYWAGLLDVADGRFDEALDRFAAAREGAARLDARPWCLLADLGAAEARAGRGRPGDAAAARSLLASVEAGAAALGMWPAHERAQSLLAGLGEGAATETPVQPRPAAAPDVFRLDGAAWTLSFAGRTAHMPDAKGLRDIHVLLGRPRTDVPAAVLLGSTEARTVVHGADDVLDDEAKRAYRRRLTELDEELEDALATGDDERAAKLDAEREALVDELRRAAGLGGRTRRLGDESERVRKTVTARIRDVIRRLEAVHPELAGHLRAHLSTGSSCRYDPPGDVSWQL